MNLRILKKLSKRAAPLLPEIGICSGKLFPAARCDNYTSSTGHERKHWERGNAAYPCNFSHYHYFQSRRGLGNPYMHQPDHPLKGTMMLGWTSGYEEPEWEEEDAWTILRNNVCGHFSDWSDLERGPVPLRRLKNPSAILKAATEAIEDFQRKRAERTKNFAGAA